MKFYDRLQEQTAADRAGLLGINIIQDALCGRIELRQYVAFLTQAYHHVRHTAPMLMACGSRLPVRLQASLRRDPAVRLPAGHPIDRDRPSRLLRRQGQGHAR